MTRQPATAAGQGLHGAHCRYPERCGYLRDILAIEAEAAAIERAAIRAAVANAPHMDSAAEFQLEVLRYLDRRTQKEADRRAVPTPRPAVEGSAPVDGSSRRPSERDPATANPDPG